MAILGQLLTSGTSAEVAYKATGEVVVSTLFICNPTGSSATAFTIHVVPDGQTKGNKHLLYSAVTITAGSSFAATAGITLSTGDTIQVTSATAGGMACSVFGVVT